MGAKHTGVRVEKSSQRHLMFLVTLAGILLMLCVETEASAQVRCANGYWLGGDRAILQLPDVPNGAVEATVLASNLSTRWEVKVKYDTLKTDNQGNAIWTCRTVDPSALTFIKKLDLGPSHLSMLHKRMMAGNNR